MTKSNLIKLICLLIIIAVTVVASVVLLGFLGGEGVRGNTIVIASGSSEVVYSGKPLVNKGWQLVSGKLEAGHSIVANVTGSQTDVGSSQNFIEAFVVDEDGNDVTSHYTVEYQYGTLTVKARGVTVTADSRIKRYDGEPLTCETYKVTSSMPMLEGHTVTAVTEGSITEIGQTENLISSVVITDAEGRDVTANYEVNTLSGILAIYSGETLVIESGSLVRPYSGQPITNDGWTIVSGELKDGHTLEVEVFGSQTEVGTSENSFTAIIYDEDGKIVTHEYDLLKWPGELTVLPQDVTISSGDAEKVYDGTPLTCPEYTISPDGLEGQFDFEITFTGERTEMGISSNTFDVVIFDKNGNDVTGNFNIDCDFGDLTVTDEFGDPGDEDDRVPGDGPGIEDGENGEGPGGGAGLDMSGDLRGPGGGGGGGKGEPTVYFTVNSTVADQIYLRMKSFGDFDGHYTWGEANSDYGVLTDDGYSAFYITALALANSGLNTNTMSITPNGGVFALPYYTEDGSFEIQTSEVLQYREQYDTYYVNYYNWDNVAGIVLPAKYRAYEEEYREFVYDNYLYVDDYSRSYLESVIYEQGFSADSGDVIGRVARYVRNAATYNLDYDPALDEEDNVAVAFLDKYKEGVCRHYATAATLLFRTLGIPARYTIGFTAATLANKEVTIGDQNYHAWVEVYVDGIGWINVEVTGSGGPSEANPVKLTVAPVYTGALYDGSKYNAQNPLTPENEVKGLAGLTKEGYTYEAEVSGSNYALGKTESEITELRIYDPFGRLVYEKSTGLGASAFIITYKPGELQLYYSELNFTSDGMSKVYDGITYTVGEENCYFVNGTLQDGYTYKIHSGTEVKNVGKSDAHFLVTVYDDLGVDRTDFYKIVCKYGKLEITAREITVTAAGASKAYDGTPLVADEILYDASSLADGDYIYRFVVSGSQTNVGKSSNVIKEITIFSPEGENVTGNYIIKTVEGILSVELP